MTAAPLVRIVKGSLTDEELAALTAVVLYRPGSTGAGGPARSWTQARWQRPERRPSYSPPHSWHLSHKAAPARPEAG